MKTFIQEGKHINVTVAADVEAGSPALYGSIFGVHMNKAVTGESCPLVTEGVVEVVKDTSTVAFGATLYWDDTAKKLTTTVGTNKKVAVAVEAAATGVALVKAKLIPTL